MRACQSCGKRHDAPFLLCWRCSRETADAHRFACYALRIGAAGSLLVLLYREQDFTPVGLLMVLVYSVAFGLVVGGMGLLAYFVVSGATSLGGSEEAQANPVRLLEQLLLKAARANSHWETRVLQRSSHFLDDPDDSRRHEAAATFLDRLQQLTEAVCGAWGPPTFQGGYGEQGFPAWAEAALAVTCWRRGSRTAFAAVRQEGPRWPLERVLGVDPEPGSTHVRPG
jgi:predicted membrane metal-binding protein